MQNDQMQWPDSVVTAAQAGVDERANFISRTYSHLFGAIVLFTLLEMALYTSGAMESISMKIFAMGGMGWLLILGAFMIVGWFASHTAHSATSPTMQYVALFGYVAAEALIFCPMLYIASGYAGAIESAALVTLLGFAALTGIAFYTRKDFSFLRGLIMWGFGIALILIIAAAFIGGLQLGLWFSVILVALAGASILYDTSNIIHHYPPHMHVGAALALFASVALMFWYVLRIVIALQQD